MPNTGNAFVQGLAYYTGDPSTASVAAFDVPKGTLVLDTTNGVVYLKTAALGTNTAGYSTLLSNTATQTLTNKTLTSPTITGGTLTGTNVLTGSVQALTAAGAVNITTLVTTIASAGAIALTLADGAAGQIKVISMITDGGDATLTPTNMQGGTTITFNDVGDTVTLVFVGTKWAIIGNTGATVA